MLDVNLVKVMHFKTKCISVDVALETSHTQGGAVAVFSLMALSVPRAISCISTDLIDLSTFKTHK